MPLELKDRRMSNRQAGVIDDALGLADECGWGYAIAYLISERIPSPIIQRLLFGGGGVRCTLGGQLGRTPEWSGQGGDDMNNLFESLSGRNSRRVRGRDDISGASNPEEEYLETQWD